MDIGQVLKSFTPRDSLNPKIWNNNKLDPKVRKTLLKVADKFIKDWNVKKKIKIHDIRFTGSLAAFNWSKFSDLDLHIVVDYEELNKDTDLVDRFFTVMKSVWNNKHTVMVGGHEIEVYVENMGEDHTATGLYSVLHDKWIKEPEKTDTNYDQEDVLTKTKHFFNLYNTVLIKQYKEGEYSKVIDTIKQVKEKIRKMRTAGLSTGGEFSTENLAFKVLRRINFLEKLNNLLHKATDKHLSEKNQLQKR